MSQLEPLDTREELQESVVWKHKEGKIARHFVYGLTVTKGGVVLACAEARVVPSDDGPHHLVLKRSLDDGVTWTRNTFIEKSDGKFWTENGRPDTRECWVNPTFVVNRKSGRVFLFYALNAGHADKPGSQQMTRVFYRYSDDDGATWLPQQGRIEMTSLLNVREDGTPNVDAQGQSVVNAEGFPCDAFERAFHLPGPGHGIQLKNGRLLVQFWHRRPLGVVAPDGTYKSLSPSERRYGVSVLYSDDDGASWKSSALMKPDGYANESRLVELADGTILINARVSGGRDTKRRWTAISRDGGSTWSPGSVPQGSPQYTQTDSGLLLYPMSLALNAPSRLLLSHPADIDKRRDMSVSVSDDAGATWTRPKTVFAGTVDYSDLVELPDGKIGLLYGRTSRQQVSGGAKGVSRSEVVFARIAPEWLPPAEPAAARGEPKPATATSPW